MDSNCAPVPAGCTTALSAQLTERVEQVERALIDASTRLPVLVFYASAMVWLLFGTLLALFELVQTARARFALRSSAS